MPPLRQYFSRLREPDESIPDPKGRELWTPQPFPLQNSLFWGPHEGAIVAFLDPRAVAGVLVGEDHAPVAAVLASAKQKKANHLMLRPQRSV